VLTTSVLTSVLTPSALARAPQWSRHGTALALAELSRRGLLTPDLLGKAFEFVGQSLVYESREGGHVVGASVRDAACYVAWAFARAYSPQVLQPYIQRLAEQLLVLSVFDREVNVRRAASAAFQEHVGRQRTIPHGIHIVQLADYFRIGLRHEAYTKVATSIAAAFPIYRQPLLRHLIQHKVEHWEESMRELVATTIGLLSVTEPQYTQASVLPTLLPLIRSPQVG
jgi:tubulin-specific chaperone D